MSPGFILFGTGPQLSVGHRSAVLLALWLGVFAPHARADAATGVIEISELKKMSIEDLMLTKVTSVSKYPETLRTAPAAIQVISGEDIRRSGFSTIADSLRLADNLNVAQKNPHDWAISARGFNANVGDKLLVLIDGRTVYTPLFSGVFWNSQDYLLEDLDRIEVISGPGGTLWGANAVNGVINITTKNAKDTQGGYVELGGGDELQKVAGARYGFDLGSNVFMRVYGKYSAYDGGALTNGTDATDSWHQGQVGFRLDSSSTPDDALTIQGDYYSGILGIQGLNSARLAGANLVGRWSHRLANDSDVSAKFYFDRTHLYDPFGVSPFQPAGFLIDDLDTYDFEFQHRFWSGEKNQIVWGLGYRLIDDNVKQQAPNLGFLPGQVQQSLYSFFVQDEIRLEEAVFLTLGTKLEHNDYTGWEIEPNVRLRWDVSNQQTLWAAVSRAVRTPSRFDRDLAEPSIPPVVIGGSKTFKSETVVTEELGYRAQFGKRASGSISLFYNEYDHLRGLSPTPVTTLPLFYTNSVEANTYGAEIAADVQIYRWWTMHAGYARLQEDLRVKTGYTDFQNALGETADPRNQFTLRSAMDFPHDLEFNAMCRWVDSLTTNSFGTPGTVPAYSELNVRLGWRPTKTLEISLVGQNLLHSHHPEYGFPGAGREELQRGFYGKAIWRF